MKKEFYCPTDAYDCPYYNLKDGTCDLGTDAVKDCDDAYAFYGDEDEED